MLIGARHVLHLVPTLPRHQHTTAPKHAFCLACLLCGLGAVCQKCSTGCLDTWVACCDSSSGGFFVHTRVRYNKRRPSSCSVSDEVVLQHAGAKDHVVTFIALAMPDHARRLFALICFPFSAPLATGVWLALPPGRFVGCLCTDLLIRQMSALYIRTLLTSSQAVSKATALSHKCPAGIQHA